LESIGRLVKDLDAPSGCIRVDRKAHPRRAVALSHHQGRAIAKLGAPSCPGLMYCCREDGIGKVKVMATAQSRAAPWWLEERGTPK